MPNDEERPTVNRKVAGLTAEPVRGSCLCGHVQYEATGPFTAFNFCHCIRCRKATGTAHCTHIVCRPDQLLWISGEADVTLYKAPHHDDYPRAFCNRCGSPVPRSARDPNFVIIPAGTLDGDPGILPERNIFWSVKAEWDTCEHGLPTFEIRPPVK